MISPRGSGLPFSRPLPSLDTDWDLAPVGRRQTLSGWLDLPNFGRQPQRPMKKEMSSWEASNIPSTGLNRQWPSTYHSPCGLPMYRWWMLMNLMSWRGGCVCFCACIIHGSLLELNPSTSLITLNHTFWDPHNSRATLLHGAHGAAAEC